MSKTQIQAHNDNARDYIDQKIEDLILLLQWYREALSSVDPRLSQSDRRVLMFALARCVDGYRAGISQSQGTLLQVARHFGVRL